jgi:hypothetical protein
MIALQREHVPHTLVRFPANDAQWNQNVMIAVETIR